MSAPDQHPTDALAQYIGSQTKLTHVCIAFSAGMDSHVLLHAAADVLQDQPHVTLRAIHINHGLHEDSELWVRHAEFICDGLGIPLISRQVVVDKQFDGPEAAARLARYSEFADIIEPGEHLLLAQHADDQAETFLLQALRGSGPDGLSSIPRKRRFAGGYLARPLLSCTQQSVAAYAQAAGLAWIDDPSNSDIRFDRNFLRQEILPLLRTRWPAVTQTLSRSAMRSAAACQTLHEVAMNDLAKVRVPDSTELSISALNELPTERLYNAVRLWVRQAGMRMPRLQDLRQLVSDLLLSREDSVARINVREYEFRRHKDQLYLVVGKTETESYSVTWSAPFNDLLIEQTGQVLSRSACERQGLQLPDVGVITVKSRVGGELIKLGEPAFHKAVKKVLQEASIPPWQRDSVPLLYIEDRLMAVWNVIVATDFRATAEIA